MFSFVYLPQQILTRMDKDKISKNTWAALALTALISIFGAKSADSQAQMDFDRRVTVIEQKCVENDKKSTKTDQRYEEIIKKLDNLGSDMSEVKSDVKLLNATKADRKYVE
jgi:uncharacterized protein (DUF1919 family)